LTTLGGKRKFFGARFSLILLRKISENRAPKKYYSAVHTTKKAAAWAKNTYF
jgi:hypothetical protein